MGPYSERHQAERRARIEQILADPNLKADARRIWTQHLNRLATSESQYNARVEATYSKLSFGKLFGED
jgi:hypothetical protein